MQQLQRSLKWKEWQTLHDNSTIERKQDLPRVKKENVLTLEAIIKKFDKARIKEINKDFLDRLDKENPCLHAAITGMIESIEEMSSEYDNPIEKSCFDAIKDITKNYSIFTAYIFYESIRRELEERRMNREYTI